MSALNYKLLLVAGYSEIVGGPAEQILPGQHSRPWTLDALLRVTNVNRNYFKDLLRLSTP
jgi:hypothetical protein